MSISLFVWALLFKNPDAHIVSITLCHSSATLPTAELVQIPSEINPLSSQLIGWGLMVIAMMLPKLIIPIQSICMQSFKRYRFINSFLFVFGYTSVWMLAGVIIVAAILGLIQFMLQSYIPALSVGIIALVWQFSPTKQQFLNRGHDHSSLAAFGWASNRDALLSGLMHGIWCVGSGWALMLFPMLLPEGHNLAMIFIAFIMISEHFEHPRIPRWHFDFRIRFLKFIVAQARIRYMSLVSKATVLTRPTVTPT
jgi:predicted metal-binding membrane protein